jgi:hypothetical protein
MEAMFNGFGALGAAAPPAAPPEAEPADKLAPFFEAGREIGEQQRKSMQAFFDALYPAEPR